MSKPSKPSPAAAKAESAIAKLALGYPEVVEENPWGHRAFKVKGKTFLFLGADGAGVSFSVKLPQTGVAALELEFTEPTHYGLGKSGWVTASFPDARSVPLELVREWLDESYVAIAPKKLASALAHAPSAATPTSAKAPSPTGKSRATAGRSRATAGTAKKRGTVGTQRER
jgi:predicted DNA-binding protein (MmcQ/YjbR family)